MDKIFQLKDISTYRSELMGWSIVWILMLHFGFYALKPLGFVAQYGYAGVDIFFFVSGFGLFFSLDNKPSLLAFYRKRLVRIFPAYYIVGAFASFLLFHDNIWQYLFRYTTIGFWTGGLYYEWYVPSILLLYLLAPLLKRFGLTGQSVLAVFFVIVGYVILGREDLIDGVHYFLLYRIPAFLLGMICAQWLKNSNDKKWFLLIAIAGIPFFVWLYPKFHQVYLYKYYSVLFLMPVFIIIFVGISKCIRVISVMMSCIGRSSLEVYLIQKVFFCQLTTGQITRSDINTLLIMFISIALGILLHTGIERVIGLIYEKDS
jgi:peptidoglycan/LPS O-acetylase OafA/YrhL